jgi:hydroxyacylglutathione hydrolase
VDDGELGAVVSRGALVIDTRPAAEYAAQFLPGTINIPLNNSFVTWAGWLVPYDVDVYLLLADGAEPRLREIVRALALIGLDRVAGYFAVTAATRLSEDRRSRIQQVTPADLAAMRGDSVPVVIDVRNDNEWNDGHLPSALHIPLGHLTDRLSELPKGSPVVMQCATGARSAIAASLLTRAGRHDVSNLAGGYQAWVAAGLPTTNEPNVVASS